MCAVNRRAAFWVVIGLIVVLGIAVARLAEPTDWGLGARVGVSALAAFLTMYAAAIQAQVAAARINGRTIEGSRASIRRLVNAGRDVDALEAGETKHAAELNRAEAHAAFIQIMIGIITAALVIIVVWTTGDV